jgi:anthranilate synthase component 1
MDSEVVTTRDAFRAAASDGAPDARVPVEVRSSVADPFAAYRRAREGGGGFYLETTGGQEGWGYFATTAVDRLTVFPDAVRRRPTGSMHTTGTSDQPTAGDTGTTAFGGAGAETSPSLGALVERLDRASLARGDCAVPFPCGAIGWIAYDVARDLEDLPDTTARDRQLPRLQVGVYDCLAAWREPRDGETELHITACPRLDAAERVDTVYEQGRERALALATSIRTGDSDVGDPPAEADEAAFESDCGRAAFADRVRRVKEYVRDGDTFQANVSQRLVAPAAVHPVAAFGALREVNPAPYSGLLEFPGIDLVSASPELLLARDGDRLVTEPIAGTRPRGVTAAEDEFFEGDLVGDEKERAEHAMLVDLERNDLGKVSRFGTVDVSEYRRVDRYSEVMHLVSLVEGRLREGLDLGDAIAAVFPGGTITGAPKPRTMGIIDEVEATRRGPYTGSIGLFGFDGRTTLNIVIRTLVRYADEYHLRVGAGIVHDSVPDSEFDETLDKARALVTAVDEALGERAAFTVEDHQP